MPPAHCSYIGYSQSWARVEGADTTMSILRKYYIHYLNSWKRINENILKIFSFYGWCTIQVEVNFLLFLPSRRHVTIILHSAYHYHLLVVYKDGK